MSTSFLRSKIGVAAWLLLTVAFLSVLFFSIFHMPAGMDVALGETGCPFMAHERTLCSMNAIDHIGVWKSAFTAIAPMLIVFALLAAAAVFVLQPDPPNVRSRFCDHREVRLLRDIRERIYTFSYRPLQEQFSNGILHAKLF